MSFSKRLKISAYMGGIFVSLGVSAVAVPAATFFTADAEPNPDGYLYLTVIWGIYGALSQLSALYAAQTVSFNKRMLSAAPVKRGEIKKLSLFNGVVSLLPYIAVQIGYAVVSERIINLFFVALFAVLSFAVIFAYVVTEERITGVKKIILFNMTVIAAVAAGFAPWLALCGEVNT